MEKQIIWTKPAIKDLQNIYEYYSEYSIQAANKLVSNLHSQTLNLLGSGNENVGQIDEINIKYRRIIVGFYKILYRILENQILINRIFDCRQNPDILSKM